MAPKTRGRARRKQREIPVPSSHEATPPPELETQFDEEQTNPPPNGATTTIQEILHGVVTLLQAQAAANNQQGNPPPVDPSTPTSQPLTKQFKDMGPPEFRGVPDPTKADSWIREIEKIFH